MQNYPVLRYDLSLDKIQLHHLENKKIVAQEFKIVEPYDPDVEYRLHFSKLKYLVNNKTSYRLLLDHKYDERKTRAFILVENEAKEPLRHFHNEMISLGVHTVQVATISRDEREITPELN